MAKNKHEFSKRDCVSAKLMDYDYLANKDDYIEITRWANGEGWDISLSEQCQTINFSISFGELKAIKKLIKELENHD